MKPEFLNSLKGYSLKAFFTDLSAGIIVGIVALPLAIAFGIASGVSPERGIFTAIVAGFVISAFGGSRVQIGGPTGAFVVIVYNIIQEFGYSGLMTATIIAGVLIMLLGIFRLGGLIKFIPYTIITGFTAGIAVTIFTSQIGDFLGLTAGKVPGDFIGKIQAFAAVMGTFNPWAFGTAFVSLAIVVLWPKINRKIPGSLVALVVMTLVATLFKLPVETIGSRFGSIPTSLPAPSFPTFSLPLIRSLLSPAISIAILASIESLLSAVVADGMIGAKHDSNMELIAQGAANILSPIFGGIPATGAIARTATNVKNGGRTPVAGIVHALTLLAIMLFLGKLAVYIPMSVLAAILVSVAWNMSGIPAIRTIVKGQKSDTAVLVVTFLLTVFIDLTVAIEFGLLLAAFFFIRKMIDVSTVSEFKELRNELNASEPGPELDANSLARRSIPKGVLVFEIDGPLFFGTVQKFEAVVLNAGTKGCKVLVLRMRNTIYIDAGGLQVLRELERDCLKRGITLIISDIHTQPYMLATKSGIDEIIGKENIVGNLDEALARASGIANGTIKDAIEERVQNGKSHSSGEHR